MSQSKDADTRKFVAAESTTSFDFNTLIIRVKKGLLNKYPGISGESLVDLMHKNLKEFRLNGQQFDFEANPATLGGIRFLVKCPKCGVPSVKLYLPSSFPDREKLYLCKKCHRLKNACRMISRTPLYSKVIKPLRRLERLNEILMEKNITPEKAQPFLDEYKKIEKELAESPEYRLFKFRKEHGVDI